MKNKFYILFILFLLFAGSVYATTDLSISVSDITFSKLEPIEGDSIRVFARVFNLGNTDAYGFVIFTSDSKEIADPQPISVKVNTYDDVFVDWVVNSGAHDIKAEIVSTNPKDGDDSNNIATKTNYYVDLDTDKDSIGNKKDFDDDEDGLSDEEEMVSGSNPFKKDTDEDGIGDKHDAFPLNSSESEDADKDGIGNNSDFDDDNDGINDLEDDFPFDPKRGERFPENSDKTEAEPKVETPKSTKSEDSFFSSILKKAQTSTIIDTYLFDPKTLIAIHIVAAILIIIFFLYRRKRL
ncbi:hypothetical protein KKC65_01765 [Patescibacteria group bacterium]|nr:hypothetical protein [Patescibacteria group bacterium]